MNHIITPIDTPESSQPYGTKAKEVLSALIFSKEVQVVQTDVDRYHLILGHVYVNDLHINRKMVQDGVAWVFRKYMKDKSLLLDEQAARDANRGVWSLSSTDQVPPWEWRDEPKVKTISNGSSQSQSVQKFKCGNKTKCSEMISCDEAKYYLNHCGLSRLDGDKDGMPCETLCK